MKASGRIGPMLLLLIQNGQTITVDASGTYWCQVTASDP